MEVGIRTIQQKDLAHLRRMIVELYVSQPHRIDSGSLEGRMSEFFLVAEEEGRVIGFVIGARGPVDVVGRELARESFGEGVAYLEVQELHVAAECRGRGVGTRLMEAVLERGRAAGLE